MDAELLLAQCIRDNEYVLEDPQKLGDLRRILTPIFIEMNQEEREELSLVIEKCVPKKMIYPLDARDGATFTNSRQQF